MTSRRDTDRNSFLFLNSHANIRIFLNFLDGPEKGRFNMWKLTAEARCQGIPFCVSAGYLDILWHDKT